MEFAKTTARPAGAVDDSSLGHMAWREVFVSWRSRMVAFVIFVGAGMGGLARYAVSTWVQSAANVGFPWGTLIINVTGSLLLTLVYGLLEGTAAAPEWRAFLGIGVLGGYTTFSTFSYESVRLLQDGEWERAVLYVAGSVILSIAGAVLGFRLASVLLQRG
jgi:CrcB protein